MIEKQHPGPKSKPEEDASSSPGVESRLKFSGEVVVEHHATPPDGPADLKIHRRRPLPSVPKDPSPSSKEEDKDS